MEYTKLIEERYSVRQFADKPVEQEQIDKILHAAQVAPTATNAQPQRIVVVTTAEGIAKIADTCPFFAKSPLAFIVCYDAEKASVRPWDGLNFGEQDASIATTQMMLEIHNIGLGATWIGGINVAELQKAFEMPQNIIPVAVLSVGYPAESSAPSPRHTQRLPLNETVFYNKYGN